MSEFDKDDPLNGERERLVACVLEEVAFDGWSVQSLRRGADAAGVDRDRQRLLFPRGVVDAVVFWSEMCDRRMEERLGNTDWQSLKIRERIKLAVKTRLDVMSGDVAAAAAGMRFLSLPMHAATGAQLLYKTTDTIWRMVGDTSTDFNFYSKRAVLSAVYSSTFMIWQNDQSEDYADTDAFLDRRIENVMTFEKTKASVKKRLAGIPSPTETLSRLRYGSRFQK